MLTQLEVFNKRVINAPLAVTDGPESLDPLQILNIDGLGPVQANIDTSGYLSLDGEFYNGSNIGKRNIVLSIRINPDWDTQTVESLRQNLYQYFMPKNLVTLQFTTTHMEQVSIDGYVESCEPNIFSKEPIVDVSIICPQPAFVGTSSKTVHGVTVLAADPTTTPVQYNGTYDNGFILDVLADPASLAGQDVRFYNTTEKTDIMILSALAGILAGGYLELSTTQGSKYVEYTNPSGATLNLLKYVAPGSTWMQLEQGINNLRVVAATAGIEWLLTFQTRYGGI